MNAQRILIRKYENRRLYDSSNSRYVNLEDIAQMVRDGSDVQVIDAANGEDVTRLVLAQIIMENAKARNSPFPLDVLKQMVIASGQASKEGFMNYMQTVGEMYQNAYRTMNPTVNPFEFFQRKPDVAAPPPPPQTDAAENYRRHLAELQQRIEELERRVRRPASSRSSKQKKSSPRTKG
jgi:polyhydroxyalkanoate synthesis repressor PhaR